MRKTVDELKAQYSDLAWQQKFVQICDLIEVLAGCIIGDGYVPTDDLNQAFRLTSDGAALRDKLITKEGVQAKEAKLMCALSLGHDALFVDIDKTNVDALVNAINVEIEKGRIHFPFIFGRDLYDRYAELHDDEKDSLSADEAIKLMDALPAGVFQYGNFTLGPFGLRAAPTSRNLQSPRHVPAYHCSRSTCRKIHHVLLDTSHAAAINRDRGKIDDLLRSLPSEAAEWWPFAAELSGYQAAYFGDQRAATLIPLVGDALSLAELRALLSALLDSTKGRLRAAASDLLVIKDAPQAVRELDRAQILQILLFAQDSEVGIALDRLVRDGIIDVPRGEVRKAVTTLEIRSGAFALRAELGRHGVRFASDDPGLPLLRERRLLEHLYLRDAETDVEELEWQLRGFEIEDIDERLGRFYHETDPRQVIARMALARKTNMIAACEEAGIEDGTAMADDELVDTILWKLGFQVIEDDDPHAEFWLRHERIWALTQSSEIGASGRFRDLASPYFSQLEGLLLDSLAFTTWALMTDHTVAEVPFAYDDEHDREAGLALMSSIATSPSGSADFRTDKVDLGNLIGGFSALARRLSECLKAPEKFRRPDAEMPEFEGKTSLKSFLLRSTVPFLDLTAPSQSRIVAGLREITALLTGAEVNLVRNDYSHYRRTDPDISRMSAALEATRQAVTRIESLGFCRLLFAPVGVTRDSWGRSFHEFAGPRSYEHTFVRPSRFDWMGLPSLREPAYLMRSAGVGESAEVLRFTRRFRSQYSEMWEGYPDRRRSPRSALADAPESHDARADVHG